MKRATTTSNATASMQVYRARQALMMFLMAFATFCLFANILRSFLG